MLPGLVSEVPERAQLLMAAFCPGPLTIIMPRGPEVAAECCAGLDTVGIRMPSHPVARAVIERAAALCCPQRQSFRQAQPHQRTGCVHGYGRPTAADFGRRRVRRGRRKHCGVGGGRKAHPVRPGHITLEDLERALGEEVEVSKAILEKLPEGAVVRSPGMSTNTTPPRRM